MFIWTALQVGIFKIRLDLEERLLVYFQAQEINKDQLYSTQN